MAGQYKGVQAVLRDINPNCLFSPCGNHTLNLVGVDSVESCKEALNFFGRIQQLYNFFSRSPQRWEILKKHLNVSLHAVSKTRWAARINSVKPLAKHFPDILKAVEESETLNLQPHARTELGTIKEYLKSFECVILIKIWYPLLSLIEKTNLLIEARNATLDVELQNINQLIFNISQFKSRFHELIEEAKTIASICEISENFKLNRQINTQEEALLHFETNVFHAIISSLTTGLTRRYESLREICYLFRILWKFETVDEEELKICTEKLHQTYAKDISSEITGEMEFLKQIYRANFTDEPSPENLLQNILEANLGELFPNLLILLRIFLSLPASVSSAERSFSTMKRIKNFNRSTMAQERLNGLAIININYDIARSIEFSDIIKNFTLQKLRKACLKQ